MRCCASGLSNSDAGIRKDSNRSFARRNSARALIKSFSACFRSFSAKALVAYSSFASSCARVEYSSSDASLTNSE